MGKTRVGCIIAISREKHPHVHGEDQPCSIAQNWEVETPPRAWGRLC